MTQYHLKILALASMLGLSLSLMSLPTLVCLSLTAYFTFRYLATVTRQYIAKGLIEICPERMRDQLLNRSIFDFVCSLWFDTSFIFLKRFFKLLFRPLMEPIDRENALEALNDMDEQMRRIYLTKGVIRVLPQACQTVFLGTGAVQGLRVPEPEHLQHIVKVGEGSSDRNTEDKSRSYEPRKLIRTNSESRVNDCSRMVEDDWSCRGSEMGSPIQKMKHRVIAVGRPKRKQPQGLIHTIHNSLSMLRRILEMQNIGGHIRRTSNATIIKTMVLFWAALLVQVKFNRSAKKAVLKTLYVLGGIITVLGVVGSTGVLIYKHSKRRRDSDVFEQNS